MFGENRGERTGDFWVTLTSEIWMDFEKSLLSPAVKAIVVGWCGGVESRTHQVSCIGPLPSSLQRDCTRLGRANRSRDSVRPAPHLYPKSRWILEKLLYRER